MRKSENMFFCFCDGSTTRWLKLFKKGFRHCFVAIKYGDVFVVLEDTLKGVYPMMLLEKDFFSVAKQNKCVILNMKTQKCVKKRFGIWYWAPTCVNFTKNIANLRTRAQTPYQLYKYLLKQGAKKWVER